MEREGGGPAGAAGPPEELVRLLASSYEALYRYVFALLADEDGTREVVQETYVALTRKYAEYDPARPFLPWACRFALREVLRHRAAGRRHARHLEPEVIARLARRREQLGDHLQARLAALDLCLERLPEADRRLLRDRYEGRVPVDELAGRSGVPRRTLFRRLERVRRGLYECVSRRLAEGEA